MSKLSWKYAELRGWDERSRELSGLKAISSTTIPCRFFLLSSREEDPLSSPLSSFRPRFPSRKFIVRYIVCIELSSGELKWRENGLI